MCSVPKIPGSNPLRNANSWPWALRNYTWRLLSGCGTSWFYSGKNQLWNNMPNCFTVFSCIWHREVRISLQASQVTKNTWLGISGSLTKAGCRLVKQREPEVLTSEKLAGAFGVTFWYAASSLWVMINRFHISTLDHVAVVGISGSC